MLQPGPSIMSLSAAAAYAVVVIVCLTGVHAAGRAPAWHRLVWCGLASLFVVMIAMRIMALEDFLRAEFRVSLRSLGVYDARRELQLFMAIGLAAPGLLALYFGWRKITPRLKSRRDRLSAAAAAAGCAMAGLVLLRLISWHSSDWLLFGPLKLNWFLDLGLALTVAVCAGQYARKSRRGSF